MIFPDSSHQSMPVNRFKRALAAGDTVYGMWHSLSGGYATEVLAGAGFDWLLVDTEHSPNDLETVLTTLQIIAAYPQTSAVVRLAVNDMILIKRYLDIGVQTLLLPQINTAQEARDAVAYTRYPPQGVRGVGGTNRATRFGRVRRYAPEAAEEICLLVQAETEQALENLEEIAAVDGIDGVFIGPADLHASMGYPGEKRRPEIMKMIERGLERIGRAGKAPGIILTGVAEDEPRWRNGGARFIAVDSDIRLLARATDSLASEYVKNRAAEDR